MDAVLRLEGVVKTYTNHRAVDEVSFEVPRGSLFGLLGPNGAGKTSLIRIITAITRADAGVIYLDGKKLEGRFPQQIGYMPEERGLYKRMKVGEHLLYLAQLRDISRAEAQQQIQHWFDKFDINDWRNKKIEELSKGMQQKIQFIATVMHRPKLLILDEPFSGLDPINTNLIKDEIYNLRHQGTSIIFSTHRMEQVEAICEHIVLINQGRNILDGPVQDIKESFKENLFHMAYSGQLPADFARNYHVVQQDTNAVTVQFSDARRGDEMLRDVIAQGIHIRSFQEILPSLNDIFIRRVKESNTSLPEELKAQQSHE